MELIFFKNNKLTLEIVAHFMLPRIFAILVLTAFCIFCKAQVYEENKFRHYTAATGLSDNFITGITQDNYGYIWISTTNGLNRFDGKEFKHFYQTPGKQELLTDKVSNLVSNGYELLIYTSKGSQWFDITRNQFTNLIVSDSRQPPFNNEVYEALITAEGLCFESTYSGVYVFDKKGQVRFRYEPGNPETKKEILGTRYGNVAMRLDDHRILHWDKNYNLSIYDSRHNNFLPIDAYQSSLPGLHSLKGQRLMLRNRLSKNMIIFSAFPSRQMVIYNIEKDKVKWQAVPPEWVRNRLHWQSKWLMINDSTAIIYGAVTGVHVVHFNPVTLEITYSKDVLFEDLVCTAAFLDKDKRLWIGTQKGLFVQTTQQARLRTLALPLINDHPIKVPFSYNSFLRIDNLLYIGNYHFLPVAVVDAETYHFKKTISFEKLSPQCNQIWSILHFTKDTLWFATQGGLVWYSERSGSYDRVIIPAIDSLLRNKSISLLFKDSEGAIWMQSYWGSGIIRYDPLTKKIRRFTNNDSINFLPLRVVNFAAEDKDHNIWFAENGLTRWNRKKDVFDTLIQNYHGFNRANSKIMSLTSDGNGLLIFSNENNGVLIFNPQTKKYRQYSVPNGLPENAVYFVTSTPDNNLWIVSHNYITSINESNGKIISYSYTDSLPLSMFNYAWHDEISRRMLFAYDDKIVWTDNNMVASLEQIPFYIDALNVAGDTTFIFPAKQIKLKHWQNNISIHFSAINFEYPQTNRYAYRINHEGWKSLENENLLRLTSLSPGNYNLEIKHLSTSNSEMGTVQNIQLVIQPPFRKTIWFYGLVVLVVVATVYYLYNRRVKHIEQKAHLDRLLAQTEMKALHSQMNPHFIFNCLNSIREMILNNENEQASLYLSKFARLIRITLDQSSKSFVSLNDTIDYLQRYLEMEQIRKSNFIYTIDVDEDLPANEIFLPPMLIQPFIENAIWHGAFPGKKLHLTIKFKREQNELVCIIDDDGIGIETSLKNKEPDLNYQSVGIANIKQRIHVLNEKYNLKSTVEIEDKSGLHLNGDTGTIVTLHLPIKTKELLL